MDERRVNNSRWARFTVKKPIGSVVFFFNSMQKMFQSDTPRCRRLSEKTVNFWKGMKLEFITHYRSEESGAFTVIAKSRISHRRTKWNKFLKLMNGSSLDICKVKRYNSPIKELKGTPHEDEVHKNLFTVDMNDALPCDPPEIEKKSPKKKGRSHHTKKSRQSPNAAIDRLLQKDVAAGKVLPSATKRGALQKTMDAVFGQEWSRGSCVDLRVFWLLEVHRRILGLEHFLATRGVERRLAELRSHALTARKYLLLDPITLALPMLLGHLRGSFDIQADATYRLLAVAASLGPLLKYGMELTTVARGRLSGQHLAEASPFLFEWPFPFLPEGMRSTMAAGQMADASASIARRIEKEQVWPGCQAVFRSLTRPAAGRRAGARAHQGSVSQEPAAPDVHAPHRAGPGPAGRGLARQGVHAPPPPDAEHAGRGVRPGGVPGADAAMRLRAPGACRTRPRKAHTGPGRGRTRKTAGSW